MSDNFISLQDTSGARLRADKAALQRKAVDLRNGLLISVKHSTAPRSHHEH